MYRFTEDGHVEVLALGARVVVPIKDLALLPEPIARAVLAELAERTASELRTAARPAPAEEELSAAQLTFFNALPSRNADSN
jgi:hypothetical protein